MRADVDHVDHQLHEKRLDTLRAQLALRGFGLQALACGGFLITGSGRSTFAQDVRGAERFLQTRGGRRG